MNLLPMERWPEWLFAAYPKGVDGPLAVAEPPDEAGEADGVIYMVRRQMYNVVLARVDPGSVIEQWCYQNLSEALAAIILWDGMPPGPKGWVRNFSARGCWRQDLETGEVWQDGCRKLWAVKVGGKVVWLSDPPQAKTLRLAQAKAEELKGEIVEVLEHEVGGWW